MNQDDEVWGPNGQPDERRDKRSGGGRPHMPHQREEESQQGSQEQGGEQGSQEPGEHASHDPREQASQNAPERSQDMIADNQGREQPGGEQQGDAYDATSGGPETAEGAPNPFDEQQTAATGGGYGYPSGEPAFGQGGEPGFGQGGEPGFGQGGGTADGQGGGVDGDRISDSGNQFGDQIGETSGRAGDNIGGASDQAGDKISDAGGSIDDGISDAGNSIGDKIGDKVGEEVGDKVADEVGFGPIGGFAGDRAEDAVADRVQDQIAEPFENLGDSISDGFDSAGDKVSEVGNEFGDQVGESGARLGDQVGETSDQVGAAADEHGGFDLSGDAGGGDVDAAAAGGPGGESADQAAGDVAGLSGQQDAQGDGQGGQDGAQDAQGDGAQDGQDGAEDGQGGQDAQGDGGGLDALGGQSGPGQSGEGGRRATDAFGEQMGQGGQSDQSTFSGLSGAEEESELGEGLGEGGGEGLSEGLGGGAAAAGASGGAALGALSAVQGGLTVLIAAAGPFLLPLLSVVLVLLLGLSAQSALGGTIVQPDRRSDAKVAKYFPGAWQDILRKAADRGSNSAPDHAVVPWTILGGLAAAQTEFGRYSPYDSEDRDPGRTSAALPEGGNGGDGGDGDISDIDFSNVQGAGPEAIQGLSGPGYNDKAPGNHPGPPQGDLSHQMGWFLWALRMHESGGDYREGSPGPSSATGAYQYIGSTWNNYKGYSTARDAPPEVQDERAMKDSMRSLRAFGNWQAVAVKHFTGGDDWARNPSMWDQCPAACGFNPTAWEFADDVMRRMQAAAERYPQSGSGNSGGSSGSGGMMEPASGPPRPRSGAGNPPVALPSDLGVEGGRARREAGNGAGDGGGTGDGAGDGGGGAGDGGGGTGGGSAAGVPAREGVYADGCAVKNPSPPIGGKGQQGVGPYLLTPGAAFEMESNDLDPQNPCDSSYFVTRKLSQMAKVVHSDPKSPPWKPDGKPEDQENARKYWVKIIDSSGLFMDRTADPSAACSLPPPDDPEKDWSVSFKIINIWRCEATRATELRLVTDAKVEGDKVEFTVETDRTAAIGDLVDEALSVSYGSSKWKSDKCDNDMDSRQGIFPMTKEEAEAAGVEDRCKVDDNIAGAAKMVIAGEKDDPKDRPDDMGRFQPMVGGWQKLSIAMGKDLPTFSKVGPGQDFRQTDACSRVMGRYLTEIAPHAMEFAKLKRPPKAEDVYGVWQPKLDELESMHGIKDPASDQACMVGAWGSGFNSTLAQMARGMQADDPANADNLAGLSEYFLGMENAGQTSKPKAGEDTLVTPRLATRPMSEIDAPLAPDASEAWTRLGTTSGVTFGVGQRAVEYAWFFGGVISPFDSAGKIIGNLGGGGTDTMGGPPPSGQTEVGPDGCPTKVPSNTLRDGAAGKGINKICREAVAAARTPAAAKAVKWALSHLGWPYSQPMRNKDGYADCSSFVSRAYRDGAGLKVPYSGGNAPVTGTFVGASWTHKISLSQTAAGDLMEPHSGHVAMQLSGGFKVHTNEPGDVSKVDRTYTGSVYWAGWVDPSKL